MNECIFMGNIVRDVELKKVGKSSIASFSIAVSRTYKRANGEAAKDVAFLEMEAWDSGGETIAKWFKKGSRIVVVCSVKQENWDDKDTGKKRSKLKFRVNSFYFPENKAQVEGGESGVSSDSGSAPVGDAASEEIPF